MRAPFKSIKRWARRGLLLLGGRLVALFADLAVLLGLDAAGVLAGLAGLGGLVAAGPFRVLLLGLLFRCRVSGIREARNRHRQHGGNEETSDLHRALTKEEMCPGHRTIHAPTVGTDARPVRHT